MTSAVVPIGGCLVILGIAEWLGYAVDGPTWVIACYCVLWLALVRELGRK